MAKKDLDNIVAQHLIGKRAEEQGVSTKEAEWQLKTEARLYRKTYPDEGE